MPPSIGQGTLSFGEVHESHPAGQGLHFLCQTYLAPIVRLNSSSVKLSVSTVFIFPFINLALLSPSF